MMKFKKIAYLLITIFALNNCSAKLVEINNFNTMASSKLGDIKLHHDKHGFCVEQDGELRDVQNCFVDKKIRNLTPEELQIQLGNIKKVEIDGQKIILERLFPKTDNTVSDVKTICLSEEESKEIISSLSQSAYIQIVEMSDGEFALHFHPRLPGGGVLGGTLGFLAGKLVVHTANQALCFGVAGVAGLFCPAAFYPVLVGMEKTTAPIAEIISNKVAFGTGVMGMLASGPA